MHLSFSLLQIADAGERKAVWKGGHPAACCGEGSVVTQVLSSWALGGESDHCYWSHLYLYIGWGFQKWPSSTFLLFLYFLGHSSAAHSSLFSSQPVKVGIFQDSILGFLLFIFSYGVAQDIHIFDTYFLNCAFCCPTASLCGLLQVLSLSVPPSLIIISPFLFFMELTCYLFLIHYHIAGFVWFLNSFWLFWFFDRVKSVHISWNDCCTVMHHFMNGIHSEKCVAMWFRHCVNIMECTYTSLAGIAYTPRLASMILWNHRRICGLSLTEMSLYIVWLYLILFLPYCIYAISFYFDGSFIFSLFLLVLLSCYPFYFLPLVIWTFPCTFPFF